MAFIGKNDEAAEKKEQDYSRLTEPQKIPAPEDRPQRIATWCKGMYSEATTRAASSATLARWVNITGPALTRGITTASLAVVSRSN